MFRQSDCQRAFDEADAPNGRIDWAEMTKDAPPSPTYNELLALYADAQARSAYMRTIYDGCPSDTNGDGDCGYALCLICGPPLPQVPPPTA